MNEIWKTINDFSDYQISNYGRVKSFKNNCGINEKILTSIKNNSGYLFVSLCKNGKCENKLIHVLEFEAFNNYKLKDDESIHHLNENKLDNNLNNFQLMTKSEHISFHMSGEKHPMFGKRHSEKTKKLMSENHADFSGENSPNYGKKHSEKTKKLMSIKKSGENNSNSILTKQNITQIIIDLNEEILTQKEIGEKFGVSQQTISYIKIKNRRNNC